MSANSKKPDSGASDAVVIYERLLPLDSFEPALYGLRPVKWVTRAELEAMYPPKKGLDDLPNT